MAEDTYSDTVIFPECVKILNERVCPLHYKYLTKLAIERLPKKNINFRRQAEDVRERLLSFNRHGTFYIGYPLFAGCLQRWFKNMRGEQSTLFPDDNRYLSIDITSDAAISAGVEAIFRSPHMRNNIPSRNLEQWKTSTVKGLLTEKIIANYFKSEYPKAYSEPDNYKKYKDWCSHDFKLKISGKTYLVDVSGRNYYDEHANNQGKIGTDFHILCRLDEKCIKAEGVITGDKFRNKYLKGWMMHNNLIPMDRFMCRLNINKHINKRFPKLDYEFFIEKAAKCRR